MTRLVIGLSGVAGSGKSTAARILSREFRFARKPIAYPLKAMVAALGVDREILEGSREDKEKALYVLGGKSARYALQRLGDWGWEQMSPNFWLDIWSRNVERLDGVNIVADDIRYPNEAQAIRDLGGIIIRLWRTGAGDRINPGHSSEQMDFEPDVLIENDGNEEDLEAALRRVIDIKRNDTFRKAANG